MGHGALLLGHAHPAVVEAVREQVARGTHYGAANPLEVEWAELITSLVPSAEKVRFTASGTEAVMLALRVARAATGRDRVVKLARALPRLVGRGQLRSSMRRERPARPPACHQRSATLTTVVPAGDLRSTHRRARATATSRPSSSSVGRALRPDPPRPGIHQRRCARHAPPPARCSSSTRWSPGFASPLVACSRCSGSPRT